MARSSRGGFCDHFGYRFRSPPPLLMEIFSFVPRHMSHVRSAWGGVGAKPQSTWAAAPSQDTLIASKNSYSQISFLSLAINVWISLFYHSFIDFSFVFVGFLFAFLHILAIDFALLWQGWSHGRSEMRTKKKELISQHIREFI